MIEDNTDYPALEAYLRDTLEDLGIPPEVKRNMTQAVLQQVSPPKPPVRPSIWTRAKGRLKTIPRIASTLIDHFRKGGDR